jgi:phage regulator Rha-like protein
MKIAKIYRLIQDIRGQRVILDKDLAVLYGVSTKNLNKAVSRNAERFPADFMLTLTPEEHQILRFQIGTLGWGTYSKYPPRAFTQEGVAMLSGVLRSPCAVKVNIEIVRAFVRLRQALAADIGMPARMKNAEAAIAEHDRELTEHAVHINEAFAEIRRLPKP